MSILDKITIFLLIYGSCKVIDTSIVLYKFIEEIKIRRKFKRMYIKDNRKKLKKENCNE
ncbi:hypothetical protein ABGF49_08290 [Helcococcus ovis]|uniref:hypothetical protein n=1 Tax=Helcococcus TaxID=31983 RepID=UPI0038BBF71E